MKYLISFLLVCFYASAQGQDEWVNFYIDTTYYENLGGDQYKRTDSVGYLDVSQIESAYFSSEADYIADIADQMQLRYASELDYLQAKHAARNRDTTIVDLAARYEDLQDTSWYTVRNLESKWIEEDSLGIWLVFDNGAIRTGLFNFPIRLWDAEDSLQLRFNSIDTGFVFNRADTVFVRPFTDDYAEFDLRSETTADNFTAKRYVLSHSSTLAHAITFEGVRIEMWIREEDPDSWIYIYYDDE